MSLFRRRGAEDAFDPAKFTPVIRCSICTGEQVAGFRENATGRFIADTPLTGSRDLEAFRRRYGITQEIEKIY